MKQSMIALVMAAGMAAPVVLAASHDHHSHSHQSHSVQIDHPWSRPTPPGSSMGVGYMTITNHNDQAITLVGAETPRAGHISIHETTMHEGVMRMQTIEGGLVIPAGETVELKPHSYHLMLERLPEPLVEGEKIPVTLDFDGAEDQHIELTVRPLDGAPAMNGHSGMEH